MTGDVWAIRSGKVAANRLGSKIRSLGRKPILLCGFLILCGAAICPSIRAYADVDTAGPDSQVRRATPFCGIYCLYSAARILGLDVEMESFFKPEYVPSEKGTPIRVLREAAKEIGLESEVVVGLSIEELERLPGPAILHVSSEDADAKFNHFQLIVKTGKTHVLIYDPPLPATWISKEELRDRWDGSAVLLSKEKISVTSIIAPSYIRNCIAIVGILVVVAILRATIRSSARVAFETAAEYSSVAWRQSVGILAVSTLLAFGHQTIFSQDLLVPSPRAKATIAERMPDDFPELDYAALGKYIEAGAVSIVDARYKADFEAGHIENALNIPVDSGAEKIRELVRNIPRTQRLVVYCQSKLCPYDGIIAKSLRGEGFENVLVYQGGWMDWKENKQKEGS